MCIQVFLAVVIALNFRAAPAEKFVSIGTFDNVRSRDGGEHCYGYSLDLWRHNGQIIGLLDRHNGLCGDPPCEALRDVSYDPGSGRLSFTALNETFTGTLRRDDVIGALGRSRVRLTRNRDYPTDADSDKSFANWCAFWTAVPRCKGVDQICRSAAR